VTSPAAASASAAEPAQRSSLTPVEWARLFAPGVVWGTSFYFIAEALRRNGDRRCQGYFREALRHGFWKPRIWVRFLQSLQSQITNPRS
jgi:hypothetical protein